MSRDRTLLDYVKNMQMELQTGAPPRKPAKPYLISSIIGLELLVCSVEYCNYTRADWLGDASHVLDGAARRRCAVD